MTTPTTVEEQADRSRRRVSNQSSLPELRRVARVAIQDSAAWFVF